MLDLRILDQELRGIHDLGEAGLVVGAQQRGAVRRDDVVADLVGERRMLGGADHLRGIGRQHDVAAAIVPHDLRLDVLAGAVGRGVHVRAEADHRHLLVGISRDRRVDIAVLVEMGVADARSPATSDASRRPRFFCFSVEGQVGEVGSDWVSITT